jgi:hypothetical protein
MEGQGNTTLLIYSLLSTNTVRRDVVVANKQTNIITMKIVSQLGLLVFLASGGTTPVCEAFSSNPQQKITQSNNINDVVAQAQAQAQAQQQPSRRELFQKTASSVVGIAGAIALPGLLLAPSQPAFASGGATAGKYT